MAGPGVLAVLAGLVGGGWLGYAGRLIGAIDHSSFFLNLFIVIVFFFEFVLLDGVDKP